MVAGAYPSKKEGESNLMEVQEELRRVQEGALQVTVTKEAEALARRDICFFLRLGELEHSETTMLTNDQRLEKLITKWIEAKHFDPGELKNIKTLEEEYIKEKLERGRQIAEDGRHIIPCTWREKEPNFADSRRYAVDDFKRLEKSKHWRDERVRKAYAEKIAGYVEKGYAEEVENLGEVPEQRKYIPIVLALPPLPVERDLPAWHCSACPPPNSGRLPSLPWLAPLRRPLLPVWLGQPPL